jgi:hypothetical protein
MMDLGVFLLRCNFLAFIGMFFCVDDRHCRQGIVLSERCIESI